MEKRKLDTIVIRFQGSYYDAIGVPQTASTKEIHAACRKLTIECHPDKFPKHSTQATEIFQKLRKMQDVLEDEKQRAEYDTKLKERENERQNPSYIPKSAPNYSFANEKGNFDGFVTITLERYGVDTRRENGIANVTEAPFEEAFKHRSPFLEAFETIVVEATSQ